MDIERNERIELFSLPMLPLRGLSVFPGMLLSFEVERAMSLAALNNAIAGDQLILLAAQKEITKDVPQTEDLYTIGTVCRVKQMLRAPGGMAKVMVEGLARAEVTNVRGVTPYFSVDIRTLPDTAVTGGKVRCESLIRRCGGLFEEYLQYANNMAPEVLINILESDDPSYVADFVTHNVYLKHTVKQRLLEELNPVKRLKLLCEELNHEIQVLAAEREISEATQEQMNQNQRDYFLREQMKVIQSELGEGEDSGSDLNEYRQRIRALNVPQEITDKLLKEVSRLAKQPFGSSEAAVLRGYLDVCLELPWGKSTREVINIEKARKVLDADHFGLEKVKERILEYLAVRQLSPDVRGGVICLVGPPGTGKTSIAASIARATNRKFTRISLGGVHDEAEIRGHRKTYVGAMPGRIIAGIRQAGSCNPLMLLDEIDKLGSDHRGDPSAALLETLDFEQNSTFRDHFLEIPFDLSGVLFVTTANTTETIPPALLDRMEVIELTSYTDEEKLQIAKRHLLPKQRKKHGLTASQLKLTDNAIRETIARYTRESGVRVLERELAAICRKTAKGIALGEIKSANLRPDDLERLLGPARYKPDSWHKADEVGVVNGLAWTRVGGELLELEVGVMEGSGKLELTGNLGDVMKESARAALTFIRSRAAEFGIDAEFYKKYDIHIHFPEGAIPKDGPSAGITICVGLISALTGIPVRRDVAMTGEVTLRGRVLAIGGLKEKTMAALRNGIHTVIIPADNEKDLSEIDQTVRSALNFITTDRVEKILDAALCRPAEMEARSGAIIPESVERRPSVMQ